jgi:serine/threonine protein kinase
MFIIDPAKRPTAAECLKHPFLNSGHLIDDETLPSSLKKVLVNTGMGRQESKSTEKTYVSNISTMSETRIGQAIYNGTSYQAPQAE